MQVDGRILLYDIHVYVCRAQRAPYLKSNTVVRVHIAHLRSGMQRGSNGTLRMVTIVSLGALVVMTFLYVMKRVEFNKASRELQLVQVE